MAPSDPNPSFIIHFTGNDIRPWHVGVLALARVMEAVNKLVGGETGDEAGEPRKPNLAGKPEALHLLAVTSGTASYRVLADNPDKARKQLARAGKTIEDPESTEPADHILDPIEELSALARLFGCNIELLPPDGSAVLARISGNTYSNISKSAFIHGQTSIEGKIERVGGATRLHCGVHMRGRRKMMICRVVHADLARQLGQHLYERAVLCGKATWYRRNWRLRRFTIHSMQQLDHRRSVSDRFSALRRIVGDAWNTVDADKFVADIRGEE